MKNEVVKILKQSLSNLNYPMVDPIIQKPNDLYEPSKLTRTNDFIQKIGQTINARR